ncbi:hypothetical protein ACVW0I_006181 [Bradyrhizobium sp. LM6.11]
MTIPIPPALLFFFQGILVSQKLAPALFAVLFLAISSFTSARAEPPAANSAAAVSPEEAKRALETLQDDKKRAQMIDTLRAIANAPGQQQPAPEQKSPIPLAADGLGAQLMLTVSEEIGEISRDVADMARTLTHFPAFYYWIVRTANDPAAYHLLIEIGWKLALVFGCAYCAEWVMFRLIRRPVAFLEVRMPQTARLPVQVLPIADPPSSVADVTPAPELHRRRHSLARAWQVMLRLPLVLGRFLLELLPVLVFVGAATALLGTEIGEPTTVRLVILAVVNAYAFSRALICAVRALAGPFGLFPVRAETAAYIEIWARRIVGVGVSGIAFANVALLLGLHRAGYAALLRMVMLVVHLFVVVIILQSRRQVAEAIRAPADRQGIAARLRNRIAGGWHYLAIALDLALWAVWALNIRNGYSLLLQYFVGTIAVVLITRVAIMLTLGLIDRGFRIKPEILQRFPGLEIRANRYLPLLRKIVSSVIAFIGLVAVLEVWGVDAIVWFYGGQIGSRLISAVMTIGVAVLIAAAIWEASNALLDRQINTLSRDGHYARAARLRTFQPMLRTALLCVIASVVGLTALSEIGVNVAPLLAGGRHRRHRHRFRFAKAGAGSDHRSIPAAGEHRPGRRQRQRVGTIRRGRERLDPDYQAPCRRRCRAHRAVQRGDDHHQCQPRRRQCVRQRQRRLQGRHRPRRSDPQGYRRRDAPRGGIPRVDPRRSRSLGHRQGRRRHGVDRRPDPLHRGRTLAGAARIQPPHETAFPTERHRGRIPHPDHLDARRASG